MGLMRSMSVRSFAARLLIFFFQAEDGIRDRNVTGVQTCALPICRRGKGRPRSCLAVRCVPCGRRVGDRCEASRFVRNKRSEEHTSELQSRFDLVCRLLLEKKNKCQVVIRSNPLDWT